MPVIQPISGGGAKTQTPFKSSGVIQPISGPQSQLHQPGAFVQQQQVSQPQQNLISKIKPIVEKVKPVAIGINKFTNTVFNKLAEVEQKGAKIVTGYVKGVKEEPVKAGKEIALGAGKGVISFGGAILSAIQKRPLAAIGVPSFKTNIPERWDVSKQIKAFKQLDEMRLEGDINAKRSNQVGEFISAFLPYTLASEVVGATVGVRLLTPAATKFAPKIVKLVPKINNVIGFLGIGQLEYDKETDGTRVDRLKNDAIMLALFEAGGVLAKGLSRTTSKIVSKTVSQISSNFKSGKSIKIESLEKPITDTKLEIKKDTGKPAEVVLAENITKASDKELQTVSTTPKIGEVVNRNVKDLVTHEGAPDKTQIAKYVEEIKAGGRSPLVVIKEGNKFGVEDGKHKLEAYKQAGITDIPTIEKVTSELKPTINENVKLVEEAIASGDLKGAQALYKDLPKEGYMPSFDSIKQRVERLQDIESAQIANVGVKEVKESYGQYQDVVQKMKNFLRIAADKKNSSGALNREHIPKKIFGVASDEIATDLGMTENELMAKMLDELNITKQVIPKAPKTIEVPRSQLPVGEGKEKVSRLEARVTESLDKTLQEIKDQLGSTYHVMNKKENIAKAVDYVINNQKEALSVLRGEKEAPQGILKNSIYVAMENLAKEDAPLARKLASLTSTRAGQELSILTKIDPSSPVKLIRDVIQIREETFIKRYGGRKPAEMTKKVVSDIKSKVKLPNKNDWNNFIESIKC